MCGCISATNARLDEEVEAGRFRQDLLFRLNTIEIHLPALRERREDIPLLANHFLTMHAQRYRKKISGFDRERHAVAARQSLARQRTRVEPRGRARGSDGAGDSQIRIGRSGACASGREGNPRLEDMSIEEVEAFLIKKALARYGGNVSHAASALGLSRSALYRRLQRYGL